MEGLSASQKGRTTLEKASQAERVGSSWEEHELHWGMKLWWWVLD